MIRYGWSSTGDETLDAVLCQAETEVVDVFDQLESCLKDLSSHSQLPQLGQKTVQAVSHFFQIQKDLMDKCEYPRCGQHQDMHDEILRDVRVLCNEIILNDKELAIHTLSVVSRWFDAHVSVQDVDFYGFIEKAHS